MQHERQSPRRTVIALDSSDCFAIDAMQITAKHFRSTTTLAYELEQYLPLDSERMVVDVIASAKGMRTKREEGLIVIADRDALETKISDLEKDGTWITGIAPRFLMGAQLWCQEQGIRDGYLIWQNGEQDTWDYLKLQAGGPTIWRWLDGKSAIDEILKDPSNSEVHSVGKLSEDLRGQVKQSGHPIRSHEASHIEVWARKVEELWNRGGWRPWTDFRRHVKTRYSRAPMYASLLVFTASLLMLLVACAWCAYWTNTQLSDSIAASDLQRTDTFKRLFPSQSVPTDIPGRLVSELRKLESAKQEFSNEPPIYSSLPIVVHFLNQLPEEAIFRIDVIRAKSQQLNSIEGSAKSLTDFQAIVSSLRTGDFQFAEPSVTQMKDGFSLKLERLTYQSKDSDQTKPLNKAVKQP